jgi:hypothetical protein
MWSLKRHADEVEQMRWCRCQGENENCCYCGGKGYLKRSDLDLKLVVPRSVPPSRFESPIARKPRRKLMAAKQPAPPPSVACRVCKRPVDARSIEEHLFYAHAIAPQGGVKPSAFRARLTICPKCKVKVRVDRLSKHEARCRQTGGQRTAEQQTPRPAPSGNIRRMGGASAASAHGTSPAFQEMIEFRMDKTRRVGLFARDRGRFGSPSVHDDFGDDSSP